MTALSKDEIVDLAEKAGCDVGAMDGREYETMWCDANQLQKLIEASRADLVAENERLKEENTAFRKAWNADQLFVELRTALSDMEKQRDYWINDRNELQFADDAKIAELSTALAAAEARETKLRAAVLVQGLQLHADKTKNELKDELNRLFPSDDSALREMIAVVYEECAKACEEQSAEPECPERAQYCADAIRALAEKARHGN